ncbi:cobalt-precorrin-5B (C(1))-methyltransferase CbiD [Chlorobium phaeovibrioides]|uniref:Cobalt-precorrin-5B C(1)-methyltransferase n=1 Tax=Chlorobium phaeovibrioides TaxID=1094 RepID=A0ABW9USW3_CHLPH|nr:cobalt-precorrin-5B (C(1))-methyltransferase CbiD [Chlorobium phaeovibrioides]MWV55012.1 cobalt-precorrin-5B (C(1))-methyltransferase [Chlorobium phaeovibrioides]
MAALTLVFGGTTEGKRSAALLDRLAIPFLYSTKERIEPFSTRHGQFRDGPLGQADIESLLQEREIGLVIDAAHPFAAELHQTVYEACEAIGIELIRYDRDADPLVDEMLSSSGVYRAADLEEALAILGRLSPSCLLALTGVQSIGSLRPWWKRHRTFFRILPRISSIEAARKEGIGEEYLINEMPEAGVEACSNLIERFNADCVLTKESGGSGYLADKLTAAALRGIPAIVVSRPPMPTWSKRVVSDMELESFLQNELQVRPTLRSLRKGYTTGASAAAATKAAMQALLDGGFPERVAITLPTGRTAMFRIEEPSLSAGSARCAVRKDAGDDPDVTNGLLIFSDVSLDSANPGEVCFLQGEGVGRVTLPGLEIPPGQPAINPVPRRMIREVVGEELLSRGIDEGVSVKISVAGGAEVAKKTMNQRLGILDGISIIGTTGEVVPYSKEAWIASIRQAIYVAGANGCRQITLTSGLRSERFLRSRYPDINARSCVHYGNFIGRSLEIIEEHGGFERVFVAVMLAKATKLAEGEPDLSSRAVSLRPGLLAGMARRAGHGEDICERLKALTLIRTMTDIVPFSDKEPLYRLLAEACLENCRQWLPGVPLSFILLDIQGRMVVAEK